MTTSIEWTKNADGTRGQTWNPTSGCDKVSPGCGLPRPGTNDAESGHTGGWYAMAMAARLKLMGSPKYQNDGNAETSGPGFAFTEHPDVLEAPLRRSKPTTYFVNSMSDMFHPDATDLFIAETWAVMGATPQHTYQILTKRPKAARYLLEDEEGEFRYKVALSRRRHAPDTPIPPWPYPNVWLGTSIESDRYAFRADHLRATPAAVRFLSLEPLLGPLPSLDLSGIDWVIVGAESGRGARPMDLGWVRDIRDCCIEKRIPFFFKQDATAAGKKIPLPKLDGRMWDEMPKRAMA
jgi:protein gp37